MKRLKKQLKASILAGAATIAVLFVTTDADASELNQAKKEFLNIDGWHQAGYTGKGVTVLVDDRGSLDYEAGILKGKVKPAYGNYSNHEKGNTNSHVFMTVALIRQLAPDADIIVHTWEQTGRNHDGFRYAATHDVQILNRSLGTLDERPLGPETAPMFEKKIFLNGSAGNQNYEKGNAYLNDDRWMSTGAAWLDESDPLGGYPYRHGYSSVGEGLDVMGLSDWEVNAYNDDGHPTLTYEGTSAATPAVSSMAALYCEYFKKQNGRFPDRDEIYAFITENTLDMEREGYDPETGHGLFILPDILDGPTVLPDDIHDLDQERITETVETKNNDKKMERFKDIEGIWTENIIMELATAGIINGYPDGTFKPGKEINRGQVAVLLNRAIDLKPVRPAKDFFDVPKGHMYYHEIQALYRAGIIDGTNGLFHPSKTLSRAQMAKVLTNAFGLKATSEENLPDVKGLWVEPYVKALYTNGITTGNNGRFNPNQPVLRHHYAAFLYRSLKQNQ